MTLGLSGEPPREPKPDGLTFMLGTGQRELQEVLDGVRIGQAEGRRSRTVTDCDGHPFGTDSLERILVGHIVAQIDQPGSLAVLPLDLGFDVQR